MTKILVVHGAGINMRGKVAVDIFGPETMDDYNRVIHEFADELGISVEIFHSNIQGEIVNAFYAAHDGDIDAAVINPAGFTASAPALVAAIGQVRFPTVEVHITKKGTESEPAIILGDTAQLARQFLTQTAAIRVASKPILDSQPRRIAY